MLAEFKTLYDIHRWLRYITWMGLLSTALFLLWASGGLPLPAWRQLLQAAFQLPQMWRIRGPEAVSTLFAPGVWSLVWTVAWVFLLWSVLALVRHHWKLYLLHLQDSEDDWVSSRHVSLAVSSAGGHAMLDHTVNIAVPRLRLPQKPPPSAGLPTIPQAHLPLEPQRATIHDVPTRPGGLVPTPARKIRQPLVQPLQVGVGWDAGIVRRHKPNEDSMVVLQATCTYQGQLVPFGLFVIADGMGGHECGQEASRLAVQNMMHTVLQNIVMGRDLSDEFLADMLIGGVEWANLAIYHRDQIENKDMGTTLTAALVVGTKAYIVNVGDSRTYLFRESSGLQQITHDHSLVASMVARGEIRPEEIYTHPERSKVYRCLGYSDELKVDSFTIDLRAYDRLLLCSDGLWEMVRDPQLERILRGSDDLSFVSDAMVQAALRGGGDDNVSVIIVQMPHTI